MSDFAIQGAAPGEHFTDGVSPGQAALDRLVSKRPDGLAFLWEAFSNLWCGRCAIRLRALRTAEEPPHPWRGGYGMVRSVEHTVPFANRRCGFYPP